MLLLFVAAFSTARYAATFPISADAKRYARNVQASPDIEVVETASGKLLQRLTGAHFAPRTIHFSPDGQTIAASSLWGEVCLWASDSGRLIFRVQDADANGGVIPLTIAFSPDSRNLAVGNVQTEPRARGEVNPSAVSLWDTNSGKRRFETRLKLFGEVREMRFVNRGKTLRVSASTVTDLDAGNGKVRGPKKVILTQDLSEDGRLAFGWNPGWIHITDVEKEKVLVHVPDVESRPIQRVVFAPGNRTFSVSRSRLVTMGDTGYTTTTIEIWRLSDAKRLWSTAEMGMAGDQVCFSPDGQKILLANGELRNTITGRVEARLDHPGRTILDARGAPIPAIGD